MKYMLWSMAVHANIYYKIYTNDVHRRYINWDNQLDDLYTPCDDNNIDNCYTWHKYIKNVGNSLYQDMKIR